MLKTTITWHDPAEELPKSSGYYLIVSNAYIMESHYSQKHRCFNIFDSMTAKKAERYKIPAELWAEIPAELMEWKK